MTCARTEIFGPVLAMIPFDSEEEAIEIANDTPYGLTNYVQTQDPARAKRMSKKLLSGTVELNGKGAASGCSIWRIQALWNWKRRWRTWL